MFYSNIFLRAHLSIINSICLYDSDDKHGNNCIMNIYYNQGFCCLFVLMNKYEFLLIISKAHFFENYCPGD